MTDDRERTLERSVLSPTADQPNLPEVSGTSFPLLTTVLAGFAVTIAVQLIIRPEDTAELPALLVTAIVIFLASTLLFISSIVFAVNAQGHNYLPFLDLSDSATRDFGVDNRSRWIGWLHRGWDAFHLASILTFYGGILLLLGGVNLIVWEFVGGGVALLVLILILANVALTVSVGLAVERRQRRSSPLQVSEALDASDETWMKRETTSARLTPNRTNVQPE